MDTSSSTAAPAADEPDEPERDDGPKDSTRLNWLEAQAEAHIKEWYRPGVRPGAPERFFQVVDDQDEVIGEGPDLRAAIDDAMGVRTTTGAPR